MTDNNPFDPSVAPGLVPELAIAPDKVGEVILLAREFSVSPGRAEAEFTAFIEAMDEDERIHLVALMWIGRGSFDAEDWAESVATARSEARTPTADYLRGTPHLAENLEAGLEALGIDPTLAEDEVY